MFEEFPLPPSLTISRDSSNESTVLLCCCRLKPLATELQASQPREPDPIRNGKDFERVRVVTAVPAGAEERLPPELVVRIRSRLVACPPTCEGRSQQVILCELFRSLCRVHCGQQRRQHQKFRVITLGFELANSRIRCLC